MKKSLIVILSLVFITAVIAIDAVIPNDFVIPINVEKVDENQVGVLIKRPYVFGSDGRAILPSGRHYIAASSNLIVMDKTPMRYKESFQDMTTKDKSDVDFDIYFKLQIVAPKADILYSDFGLKWYSRNLQSEFRRVVRVVCMKYDMELLTSDSKISQEIEAIVEKECKQIITDLGIPVILVNVNMGSANPPKQVKLERNKTAAAKQREKTLVQQGKNEDQRKSNEEKRASADKAYQSEMGLTTAQYIQLKQLEVQEKAYSKASTVIINGQATPTVRVK
jgi:regulator of protease activity HflC (stomatin/prohibitin superfamily)